MASAVRYPIRVPVSQSRTESSRDHEMEGQTLMVCNQTISTLGYRIGSQSSLLWRVCQSDYSTIKTIVTSLRSGGTYTHLYHGATTLGVVPHNTSSSLLWQLARWTPGLGAILHRNHGYMDQPFGSLISVIPPLGGI